MRSPSTTGSPIICQSTCVGQQLQEPFYHICQTAAHHEVPMHHRQPRLAAAAAQGAIGGQQKFGPYMSCTATLQVHSRRSTMQSESTEGRQVCAACKGAAQFWQDGTSNCSPQLRSRKQGGSPCAHIQGLDAVAAADLARHDSYKLCAATASHAAAGRRAGSQAGR